MSTEQLIADMDVFVEALSVEDYPAAEKVIESIARHTPGLVGGMRTLLELDRTRHEN